ncbi:MAG: ABC transporter permease [Alphaproteobacteria bacterium]|nr:ABC transporter permease [Alphaproteobacteria bacterium]
MRDALFLAWSALRAAPGRVALVVLALGVAAALPLFTTQATQLAERRLLARAEATPVVLGAPGNPFDLTLTALWFRGEVSEPLPVSAGQMAEPYGLVVPLRAGHGVGGTPVVGVGAEYLEVRGLDVAEGRRPALLGEVVVGARAAEEGRIGVGDQLRADQGRLFNLAEAAPLMLEVVGVLAPCGGPEDNAVLADLHTAWALDGSLHGHAEVAPAQALNPEAAPDEALDASAALFLFDELSEATRPSFHAHGDPDALPVDALLVFPKDRRALDQLLGDDALNAQVSAVRPAEVVREVLAVVFRVEALLTAAFAATGLCAILLVIGITALSLRLRREELALMRRLGCSPGVLPAMIAAELVLQGALALALAFAASQLGLALLDRLLLS